jgi:hypothetical protein
MHTPAGFLHHAAGRAGRTPILARLAGNACQPMIWEIRAVSP